MLKNPLVRETDTVQSILLAILGDAHFWIPVLVLLGGLGVLRWIS